MLNPTRLVITGVVFAAIFLVGQHFDVLARLKGETIKVVGDFQVRSESSDTVSGVFLLKNIASKEIVIDGINATCNCVTTEVPITISPRSTYEFQVELNEKTVQRGGYFDISLFCGQHPRPVVLTIDLFKENRK